MRRRIVLILTCVALFVGLSFAPLVPQSTQLPMSVIWNRVYNKALGIPAEAQGTQLPIADILNRLFNPLTDMFNFGTTGSIRPLTCAPLAEFFVNAVTKCLEVCNATGNGWDEQPGCSGGLLSTTTGIRVNVDSVKTLRYAVTTTTTDMTLDQHLELEVFTLGAARTISLPDPADPLKGGRFEIFIGDNTAGTLRLAPTAGATINGISAPTAPITGQFSYFLAKRQSNTGWRVDAMTTLP